MASKQHRRGLGVAIALLAVIFATGAGCAGIQTQHQKIAAACEASATAADTIVAGKAAGRVTTAQAANALQIYRVTVPFCQPEPVQSLSSVDYAALINAAAQLATISEKAK